jgi:Transposase DDE domain group 1
MNASGPKAYTIRGVDAMPAAIASPLHLAPVEDKAILGDLEGGRWSSAGGLVLLTDPDDQRGLTRALAAVLRDPRDPRRVNLTRHDLRKQRGWPMAAGSADANDATTLRHAPLCTLRRGRLPESGPPWASPPTLSRCENRVSRTALSRLARVLVEPLSASYHRPPQLIVLDFDDTEDPAPGAQESSRDDG